MKKITILLHSIIFMFLNNICAMHEANMHSEHIVHAGIAVPTTIHKPSSAVIATAYNDPSVNYATSAQATVIKSSQPSGARNLKTQDDSAIPSKTLPQLTKSQSLSFDDSMPIAIAKHLIVEYVDKAQPIIIYNAQGKKISEHVVNDDGSEQNTVYETNGDVITTLLNSKKIRQQVTTKKPNNSSVIQRYNEQGKQEAVETVNPDGSRVKTFNTLGDQSYNVNAQIINSEIYNKQNQLETSLSLNDYGQASISNYNSDGSMSTNNPDGTTTTVTPNADGTTTTVIPNNNGDSTSITKNAQGKVIKQFISYANGSFKFTAYDSKGEITDKFTKTINSDGSSEQVTYNPERRINRKNVKHRDGTEEQINYDVQGKITDKTIKHLDGTVEQINYDVQGKITDKTIQHLDGTDEQINYDVQGKITDRTIQHLDGTVEQINYDVER